MTAILVHTVCVYNTTTDQVREYDKPVVITGSFFLEPLREGFTGDDAVRDWVEKNNKKLPGCSVVHSTDAENTITYLEESFEEVCEMLGLRHRPTSIRRIHDLEVELEAVRKSRDAHCRVRDRCIDRLREFMGPAALDQFLDDLKEA